MILCTFVDIVLLLLCTRIQDQSKTFILLGESSRHLFFYIVVFGMALLFTYPPSPPHTMDTALKYLTQRRLMYLTIIYLLTVYVSV